MEREAKWESRFGKGALGGILGGEAAKIAGLPIFVWQTLLTVGAFSAAFWVAAKLASRSKPQCQPT